MEKAGNRNDVRVCCNNKKKVKFKQSYSLSHLVKRMLSSISKSLYFVLQQYSSMFFLLDNMYLTARVWRGKGSNEICYFFTLTRFSFGILHTTTYFSYYVPSTPKCIQFVYCLWVYVRIHICYILLQKLYCVFKKYILSK